MANPLTAWGTVAQTPPVTGIMTFPNIAALRMNADSLGMPVFIVGLLNVLGDPSGGWFIAQPQDITSADNGLTVIVDSVNMRWYRVPEAAVKLANSAFVYSANMTADLSKGSFILMTVNNATAWTLNAPINVIPGQEWLLAVYNNSGGAMGVGTAGANIDIGVAAFPDPGNGKRTFYKFYFDGAKHWCISTNGPIA